MLMGMFGSWCPWQHTALWAPNRSDTKAIHNAQAGGIPLPVNLLLAQVRGHPATDMQVARRASLPNIAAAAARHKRSSCYRCWWARMPSWPRLQCPPSSGAGSCMVSNQPPAQQGWHLPCVGAHSGRCQPAPVLVCFLAQCLGLIARHMMCCANPCQLAQVCPSASALVRRIQLYTGQLVLKCAKTCISRASGGQSLITSGQPEGL